MGKGRHTTTDDESSELERLPVSDRTDVGQDSTKKESTASDQKQDGIPKPPDGGWGWMVVFSSFLIHVIADGIVYSFGVFLIEFVDYFNAGRGAASWVGSLQPAVTYTVGPLSSALTNRYGCRFVTILGAIIASVGFVISMFSPNLYFLYVTAGVMAGLGFGLIYLPAIVCVAQYFEKRRSFATGLAVCGSGFGTFILAPIVKLLVQKYSWRGSFLILGGVILNVIICGIIFRPLEAEPETEEEDEKKVTDTESSESQEDKLGLLADDREKRPEEQKASDAAGKLRGEGEGLEVRERISLSNGGLNNANENQKGRPNGTCASETDETDTLASSLVETSLMPPDTPPTTEHSIQFQLSTSQFLAVPHKNGGDLAQIAASDGALNRLSPHSAARKGDKHRGGVGGTQPRRRLNSHGSSPVGTPRALSRKDIFYSGSLLNIPMYKSNADLYIASVTHLPGNFDMPDSSNTTTGEKVSCACFALCSEMRSTMKEMLSFSLLKNPVFLMFGISNFFTSIGFNMPFIFLPDRAQLSGVSESQAAFLLSVIGIANTAGRVIFGFLSDRPWVNRLYLYNTALTICGVATALSPAVGDQYGFLVAYAAIFGMFIGVYVSLTSVVLVDLLGLEYLTNSFGLLLLFQGAATFIGPPIAGWIFDWTGSYDISFVLMGSLIALSGAMLFFLPCVERRHNRKMCNDDIKHDMDMGKLQSGSLAVDDDQEGNTV